ncbi:hypothetical protein ACWGLF_18415 [Streptomyces puniciscabiei]
MPFIRPGAVKRWTWPGRTHSRVPGRRATDSKPYAFGQIRALDAYLALDDRVAWTYLSPLPVHFAPGERTGRHRTGLDQPVVGDDGQARISYEDYAAALGDEIENPRHLNRRFTVGY